MKTIGIIGAGIMGGGIARVLCGYQKNVALYDINAQALLKAEQKISSTHLRTTRAITDLSVCDLIIEAMSENKALKIEIFEKLSTLVPSSTVLASNTSSFSISDLALHVSQPERFLGIHFMNPPHKIPLVEIISGAKTDQDICMRVRTFLDDMERQTVLCQDRPGFLVNRILFRLILEGIRVLEEETASIHDIDQALKVGANLPMGPLELADFIGLDTCVSILQTLDQGLANFSPPTLLLEKVKRGELGRKSGHGFYAYA